MLRNMLVFYATVGSGAFETCTMDDCLGDNRYGRSKDEASLASQLMIFPEECP